MEDQEKVQQVQFVLRRSKESKLLFDIYEETHYPSRTDRRMVSKNHKFDFASNLVEALNEPVKF